YSSLFFYTTLRSPRSTLFPYTTLFRSSGVWAGGVVGGDSWCGVGDGCARWRGRGAGADSGAQCGVVGGSVGSPESSRERCCDRRSEEHTSELQSRFDLVCRLLLEKKKA